MAIQNPVETFISSPGLQKANISLMVKDIKTGRIVYQHRADKATTPASTTKILTTLTALETLGPDFRFRTQLQYDGYIKDNTLFGNIYLLGGGDPTLGSEFLNKGDFMKQWVKEVKKLGINKITGSVIGDATLFSDEGLPPCWTWQDIGNYYGAGAYGLSIFDNTYKVYFKSGTIGNTPEILKVEPIMPDLKFHLLLKSDSTKEDNSFIYGAPFCADRFITGTIPCNTDGFVCKGSIPQPALYAVQVFENRLRDEGISIEGEATTNIPGTIERTTFFTQMSPELKDIIKSTNYRSDNLYAQHIFLYLGLQQAAQSNSDDAYKTIMNYLGNQRLDTTGIILRDGCGLCHDNAIPAEFMVDLLIHEKTKGKYGDDFEESLPIAGRDGTVKHFLKGTALDGKVHAKSGSLYATKCYAGYIDWKDNEYAFAVMVDNFYCERYKVIEYISDLLNTLAI